MAPALERENPTYPLALAPRKPPRKPPKWVLTPDIIEHERNIIRTKFLADIERKQLKIDLTAPPLKIPIFRIRHNESEIKKRWYATPQAWEHHNRRAEKLIQAFQKGVPIPPVMARKLGPDRYRIWDGNHRLIAAKRAGVKYVYVFPVLPTKVEQMPERNTVQFKGVLYDQVNPPRK
jgi:hypothetical protein